MQTSATSFSPKPLERFRPLWAEELRDAWPAVIAPLGKLLKDRGDYRTDDILEALQCGDMQLWQEGDTWAITQIQVFPAHKVAAILYAGGNLSIVQDHLGDIEAWGVDRGCNILRVHGRAGWSRVFDLDTVGLIMEKRL